MGSDVTHANLAAAEAQQKTSPAFKRLVIASGMGTAIEHYDFFLYAFTAPLVFDAVFFPKLDPAVGLIAVFATYTVGFLSRPLGGIVFGHFGDRIGRKAVLTLTLLIMGVASVLIGFVPGYVSWGVWAPIALTVCRFIQGFAFGGEYMNAVTLTLENSPSARRGFFAGWVNASGPIGIVIASGLVAILTYVYTREDFTNWLWRVPFVLSIVLVGVGTYIRLKIDESTLFQAVQAQKRIPKVPLSTVLASWKKSTLIGLLVNMAHSSFSFLAQVFALGYAVRTFGASQAGFTAGIMLANIAEIVSMPIMARYSDRLGRRPFIIAGIVLMAIWFPIYFQLIQQHSVFLVIVGLVVAFGLCHGTLFGAEAAFTAELFPTEVRVSGSSLAKQLGVVLGGGLAPLVASTLMAWMPGNVFAVTVYFEAMAVLALVGVVFFASESYKRAL